MLARKNLSKDPALASDGGVSPAGPCLHDLLDSESLQPHTLLLLFLLPESNRSDIDPDTLHAVEVLSDVQTRLARDVSTAPFEQDKLAGVIECLSDIRFGVH